MTHIDVPPAMTTLADYCPGHETLRGDLMGASFYCDGTCLHGDDLAEALAEIDDDDPCPRCGGDHDRIDRREPCPEPEPTEHEGHAVVKHSTAAYCATCDAYWTLPRPEWLGTQR
jgi:hypothetical protein